MADNTGFVLVNYHILVLARHWDANTGPIVCFKKRSNSVFHHWANAKYLVVAYYKISKGAVKDQYC